MQKSRIYSYLTRTKQTPKTAVGSEPGTRILDQLGIIRKTKPKGAVRLILK